MARDTLELTFRPRWWWPWFVHLVVAFAWVIHRFVSDECLASLADRAVAFGARHGFKIGTR